MRFACQTGMMPVAFPTKCHKSHCLATEAGALQKDLQSKTLLAESNPSQS